jgi:hypothetical protein
MKALEIKKRLDDPLARRVTINDSNEISLETSTWSSRDASLETIAASRLG